MKKKYIAPRLETTEITAGAMLDVWTVSTTNVLDTDDKVGSKENEPYWWEDDEY